MHANWTRLSEEAPPPAAPPAPPHIRCLATCVQEGEQAALSAPDLEMSSPLEPGSSVVSREDPLPAEESPSADHHPELHAPTSLADQHGGHVAPQQSSVGFPVGGLLDQCEAGEMEPAGRRFPPVAPVSVAQYAAVKLEPGRHPVERAPVLHAEASALEAMQRHQHQLARHSHVAQPGAAALQQAVMWPTQAVHWTPDAVQRQMSAVQALQHILRQAPAPPPTASNAQSADRFRGAVANMALSTGHHMGGSGVAQGHQMHSRHHASPPEEIGASDWESQAAMEVLAMAMPPLGQGQIGGGVSREML